MIKKKNKQKNPQKNVFLHIGGEMMDRLEEDVFVLYQRLYHLPLVADVIQCCHGVKVRRTHQSGTKDDPQILCVHQVILLILCHPKHNHQGTMDQNYKLK